MPTNENITAITEDVKAVFPDAEVTYSAHDGCVLVTFGRDAKNEGEQEKVIDRTDAIIDKHCPGGQLFGHASFEDFV